MAFDEASRHAARQRVRAMNRRLRTAATEQATRAIRGTQGGAEAARAVRAIPTEQAGVSYLEIEAEALAREARVTSAILWHLARGDIELIHRDAAASLREDWQAALPGMAPPEPPSAVSYQPRTARGDDGLSDRAERRAAVAWRRYREAMGCVPGALQAVVFTVAIEDGRALNTSAAISLRDGLGFVALSYGLR